jgi:hypothetical protein
MSKTQLSESTVQARLILWALWVGFNTAAALLAVVMAKVIVLVGIPGEVLGFLIFLLCVVLLGLAQGLVLARHSIGVLKWMVVNFGSWVATYLATMVLNLILPDLLVASISSADSLIIFGAVSGLVQWLFLRAVFRGAWVWILAMIAGWGLLGLLTGAGFASEWAFVLIGLVPSIFTGAALAWLWNRHPQGRRVQYE